MLEYYNGQLPGWLSPVQVYLLPLGDEQIPFVKELEKKLVAENIRVQVDLNQGRLSKRILFAHQLRPFAKLVIGAKEVSSGRLELQLRDEIRQVHLEDLVGILKPLLV